MQKAQNWELQVQLNENKTTEGAAVPFSLPPDVGKTELRRPVGWNGSLSGLALSIGKEIIP